MRKLVISSVLLAVLALFGGPAIAADDPEETGQASSASDRGKSDKGSDTPSDDASASEPDPTDDSTPAPEDESEPEATELPEEEPTQAPDTEANPAGGDGSDDGEGEDAKEDPAAEVAPDEAKMAESGSVTICHRDDASDVFAEETVSADAAVDGHDSHDGDVIPAFDHADGHYDGKNYDDAGKALLDAGCQAADVPLLAADALVLAAARPVAAALAANVVAAAAPAAPTVNNVPICHRTNSEDSPYVTNSPSANGVINGHGNNHTGPIFTPGLKAQGIKWGDIIPPFDFGPGLQFAGLNWTAEGQAIYNNGCQFAGSGLPGAPPAPDDDDDDGDDGDDGDDSDDSDDDSGGLPDAGGAPLWTLLLGFMLIASGMAIVNNRQLGAKGLLAAALGSTPAPATFVPRPAGRHVKPADDSLPVSEEDMIPPVPPSVPDPAESPQVEASAVTADRPHWQGATLIALGLAGAAIAIRRALR